MYNLNLLLCPRCEKGGLEPSDGSILSCAICQENYPVIDDIPVLLKYRDSKSKLEDIDYDLRHPVNEITSDKIYRQWKTIFDRYILHYGDLLEIGCGTGMLTYGLIKNHEFNSIHASDISIKLLRLLQFRLTTLNDDACYYACDANYLPFRQNIFDVVVGNSVLHHFLDYQQTLRQAFHSLRKDGVAIFYEPIIQGKIFLTYLIRLMMKIEEKYKLEIFDDRDMEAMQKIVTHQVTIPNIKNNRKILAHIEDKYIFDLTEMKTIASEIGYREIHHVNAVDRDSITYKPYMQSTFVQIGINKDKLKKL